MHPVIQKTLGGLSRPYYFRQFVFGLLPAAFFFFMSSQNGHSVPSGMLVFIVLSTLLYPYSRFVYESIMGFIMGNNMFLVNAVFMLVAKFITMVMCWAFSIFIAPVGLAYLYYHHTKAEKLQLSSSDSD